MNPAPASLTRGSISKKPAELLQLKEDGHRLIDQLVASGVTRGTVYRRLAKRLGIPEPAAHFGPMNKIAEAQLAVDTLKSWLEQRIKSMMEAQLPPHARYHRGSQTLPWPQQQEAFAELKRRRERGESSESLVSHRPAWYARLARWIRRQCPRG